jgi:hypothetical protein
MDILPALKLSKNRTLPKIDRNVRIYSPLSYSLQNYDSTNARMNGVSHMELQRHGRSSTLRHTPSVRVNGAGGPTYSNQHHFSPLLQVPIQKLLDPLNSLL